MFKAIYSPTSQEVITLGLERPMLEALRSDCHKNLVCCPICKQSVLLRAGKIKRPHFAHKTSEKCPTRSEPAELLMARAVLYDWLKTVFDQGVTIEKYLPQLDRVIDVWVEHEGQKFAYLILTRNIRSREERKALAHAAKNDGFQLFVIFLSSMVKDNPDQFRLSPSEYEFAKETDFDLLYSSISIGSLHYIDAQHRTITTLRGVRWKDCSTYKAKLITSTIDTITIDSSTGELAHPDESERLKEFLDSRPMEIPKLPVVKPFVDTWTSPAPVNRHVSPSPWEFTPVPRPVNPRPHPVKTEPEKIFKCEMCDQFVKESECYAYVELTGIGKCKKCGNVR